jgi:hypothetical protein
MINPQIIEEITSQLATRFKLPTTLVSGIQIDLNSTGYGPITVDGFWGPQTDAAWQKMLGKSTSGSLSQPVDNEAFKPKYAWPKETEEELNEFYGYKGQNLIMGKLPYPMFIAWDQSKQVNNIQVNAKCYDALCEALEKVYDIYGRDIKAIHGARMDLFGGCFNKRLKRNGTTWSVHSWGAAIDIDPENNRLGQRNYTMPFQVINCFRSVGANPGAMWKSCPDAMHFQFTK